jgi:hypothetical protein
MWETRHSTRGSDSRPPVGESAQPPATSGRGRATRPVPGQRGMVGTGAVVLRRYPRSRRRRRYIRLRDLDPVLRSKPLDLTAVQDALRRIPIVEPVDKRISAAIIGVPQGGARSYRAACEQSVHARHDAFGITFLRLCSRTSQLRCQRKRGSRLSTVHDTVRFSIAPGSVVIVLSVAP